MPLDDVVARYSTVYRDILAQNPMVRKAGTYDDGKMYEMGRARNATTQRAFLIRQDWLDKLGLSVPNTIEEFYQVARAFVERDPDGNGVRDTYGFAMSNDMQIATFSEAYSVMYTNHALVNGEYVHAWDQLAAFYSFLKRLYDENLIDRDFLSDNNGNTARQSWLNGKSGINPSNAGEMNIDRYTTMRQNSPTAKVANIKYPITQFGRVNPSVENPIQMTAVINADARDPEAIMKLVDWSIGFDVWKTLAWGFEGVNYQMVDGLPLRIRGDIEVQTSYGLNFDMLSQLSVTNVWADKKMGFNLSVPLERELFDLRKSSYLNFDYSIPMGNITHSEHMPQLPADLLVIRANLAPTGGTQHQDFFQRAIVGGTSYTVDMALRDARAAWERGGGQRVDDWYRDWYRNNKDTAFLYPSIYEVMKQQDLYNWYAP